MEANYHHDELTKLVERLDSNVVSGLSSAEAQRRLNELGQNRISARTRRTVWDLFIEQFSNLLVVLLIAASLLSFFLGSTNDGIVLMVIVLINSLVGFFQDWKSENIVSQLGSFVCENVIVVRNGVKVEIPASALVIGDLLYLQEGDGVPADCRLIRAESLMTNEFALTGESVPTQKDSAYSAKLETSLSDRQNCVFLGTSVARGEALALVCSTGNQTELGKIAVVSQAMTRETSPLQKELSLLGVRITRFALALALIP